MRSTVLFSVASAALWAPIVVYLVTEGSDVVGGRAMVLLVGTVVLQLMAVGFAATFIRATHGWDDYELRRGALVSGWASFLGGASWALFATFSMLELGTASGDGFKLPALIAFLVVLLGPPLIPPKHAVLRGRAAIAVAIVLLAITAAVTFARLSPLLIAPATIYVMAAVVNARCTRSLSPAALNS